MKSLVTNAALVIAVASLVLFEVAFTADIEAQISQMQDVFPAAAKKEPAEFCEMLRARNDVHSDTVEFCSQAME